MCQKGVMKKSWMEVTNLIMALTILNHPVDGSIIVNASREFCCYHYIQENVEDEIIKIEFVKSINNDSDIFTKNVNQVIFGKHVKNF